MIDLCRNSLLNLMYYMHKHLVVTIVPRRHYSSMQPDGVYEYRTTFGLELGGVHLVSQVLMPMMETMKIVS